MKLQTTKGSIQLFIVSMLFTSSISVSCADAEQSDFFLDQLKHVKSVVLDSLELPKLGVPSIKVEKKGLDLSNSAYLNMNNGFNDEYRQSNYLFTNYLDLTHRDHLLYYGLVDSDVKLDLGMNIMKFHSNIRSSTADYVRSGTQDNPNNDVSINKYTPAFYIHAAYTFPSSTLCIASEVSLHRLNQTSISDYKVFITMSANAHVDSEVGYHSFDAQWQNFDGSADNFSFQGIYGRVTYSF